MDWLGVGCCSYLKLGQLARLDERVWAEEHKEGKNPLKMARYTMNLHVYTVEFGEGRGARDEYRKLSLFSSFGEPHS